MVRIGENRNRFNIAGRSLHERRTNTFLNNRSIGAKMFPRIEIGSGGGLELKNLKIMVVDDDYSLLRNYADNFKWDYRSSEILEALDGQEALAILKNIIPGSLNIALIDTYMTAISGFDVAEKVREKHPAAYIILKSSNVSEAHRPYFEKRIVDVVFDTNTICWTLEKGPFFSSFEEVMATAVRIANERSCAANK
jgi:CheY-like chemotaxis protein